MTDVVGEKTLDGWITYNWKTGIRKLYNKKPKKVGPYDVVLKLNIKLVIPEFKEILVSGNIVIPEMKVKEIITESI